MRLRAVRIALSGVLLLGVMAVASPAKPGGVASSAKPPSATSGTALAPGPQPGDLFREYRWWPEGKELFLRVGGSVGYDGGLLEWAGDVDLIEAIRAEVVIEKLLCHDGTRGLAISINGHGWLSVPEAPRIPAPQCDYQHHFYPIVPLALNQIRGGPGNTFQLRVNSEHPWKWPQNLIYGAHLRVYYDPTRKPHPEGRLIAPSAGGALGETVTLEARVSTDGGRIRQVDFLGLYDEVNFEGDGRYRQWHYYYLRGRLTHHIGTVTGAPYRQAWDTSWVPDQSLSMQLAAWVTDESGLTIFTDAVGGLHLDRLGLTVELCKPYDVPKKWVTRSGEHEEKFCVTADLSKAVAAQLVWSSWSPGYMEGIYINGHRVFDREGPRYAYATHRVTLTDLSVFKPGENILKTGKTPLHNGQMVHGMEVNWPGIMVLIQRRP